MNERILITGANGNLGGCLVKELIDNTKYDIVAISSESDKVNEMLERENVNNRERVVALSTQEFLDSDWSDYNVSAAVHMAFSRSNRPFKDIASSLDFSQKVYRKLHEMRTPRIIYLSSQSVYGSTSEWRTEDLEPSPEIAYSMAKYAGEKLLESEFLNDKSIQYSILRLDYVIQSQRLVPALCKNAKETHKISLKGGKQTFSYIDRTDVAKAIVALLNRTEKWKHIYNVGPNKMRFTLMEIAKIIENVAKKHGIDYIDVELEQNESELWSGMDSTLFMNDTGWRPSKNIYQMVEKIFQEI